MGKEVVGAVLQNFGARGDRITDLRQILQGSGAGDTLFWIEALGDDPKDRPEPREFLPKGGLLTCGDEAVEGWHIAAGITAYGGID